MSKRLYVATKFEVSYDSAAGFNWHFNEFKDLLDCLGVSTCDTSAELTDGYGDEWECPYDEFEEALEFLKEYKNVIKCSENSDMTIECNGVDIYLADVYEAIDDLECGEDFDESVNEAIRMMDLYSKQCAKADGYMHFQAF